MHHTPHRASICWHRTSRTSEKIVEKNVQKDLTFTKPTGPEMFEPVALFFVLTGGLGLYGIRGTPPCQGLGEGFLEKFWKCFA